MKRIIYSGTTKIILATLLMFCFVFGAYYGFLTLRAPFLYGTSDNVYETKQYSELFSKYVERTAVYVRYREDGYELSSSAIDPELALLLNGESTDMDLEGALFNVYEPSETAFYYYHTKLNEEPTNYQYYVKNTETGQVYASKAFTDYAIKKSGSLDAFLSDGIMKENLYLILNTGNNRTMTGGGNSEVLNRSNLLWSMDFLRRPLSEMAEDMQYDYNYPGTEDSSDATKLPSQKPPVDLDNETPSESSEPPATQSLKRNYLLYAFVADTTVTDAFTELAENFTIAKEDQKNKLQPAVTFGLLSLFLFTISNMISGRDGDNRLIRLHFYDRIFTELVAGALIALFFLPFIIWNYGIRPHTKISLYDCIANFPQYKQWVPLLIGCLVLFLFIAGLFYFSLIRRIKADTFLSSSFLGRYVFLPLSRLNTRVITGVQEFLSNLSALWKTFLHLILAGIWLILSVFLLLWKPIFGIILLIMGAEICTFIVLRNVLDHTRITRSTELMSLGNLSTRISTESMLPSNKRLSEDINHICDGLHFAVEEQTKSERMKTELITNVSHDIKTPLTSIINYIELIKNELPKEGTVAEYAEILSQKSWRLKALIDDLVEASKASSGTIQLEPIRFNAVELLHQVLGDFEERLTDANLSLCTVMPETPVNVLADGACTHRIIENMMSNVCKYALSGTRVFVSLDTETNNEFATLIIKNTSASILSKTPEELLTRFARGDESRSDDGSGLGLSIAESLAALQGGNFSIEIDGDLFKAVLTIPLAT